MSVGLAKGEYTVGWICALSTELTAAMAMLDEIHPSLPRPSSDTNTYVLGRAGVHNVVIACLPQGRTGITSAAIAANLMKHTFSSIQFSLMVGIGGGVPGVLHDIRLGDVVVSTPSPQSGGVVQYDFGKTLAEGRFVRTNVLAPPPTVLLTAISLLRARHEAFGNQLAHYLSAVSSPKLQLKYTYQGAQHDQLFVAEYDHIGDVDCEKCDDSKLVMRPERDSLDPVAHYGTIASASQVMRHGGTRDRLGSELDVLCFEMEAAGLMNDFPCVVIRGVSDYADSHKNKRWQGYAAATAAAYAKELLSTIPPLERSVTPAIDNQLGTYISYTFHNSPTSECILVTLRWILGYRNEHYLVPHNVSSMFTGRDDICQLLRERCLRSEKHGGMEVLKVFVLYGLGGSGKTQVCLKFAHDHREEYASCFRFPIPIGESGKN
jgi:nucleoside phosphorylase